MCYRILNHVSCDLYSLTCVNFPRESFIITFLIVLRCQLLRREYYWMWSKTGDSVSQEDVRKLIKEVDEFVLASHLHWALWGLLSVRVHFIYHNESASVVFGY